MSNQFSMFAGDTPRLVGTVVQYAGGPPFDLTGYGVSVVGQDFSGAGVVDDGPGGAYHVDMPSSGTVKYKRGSYPYRIVITLGAQQFTIISDKFTINP